MQILNILSRVEDVRVEAKLLSDLGSCMHAYQIDGC